MVVQDGQQQMLFLNARSALQACFQYGQLQNVAGFLVEHQVAGVDRHSYLVLPDAHFQLRLDCLHVDVQSVENIQHGTFLHAHQRQQQVLGAHAAAGQPCGFLAREGQDFGYFG